MKILIGDKGGVDFDSALKMDDKMKTSFLSFLQNTFDCVKIVEDENFHRTDRIGSKAFSSRWDECEKKLLYNALLENEVIAEKVGRTWLSIANKRGPAISEFQEWAKRKGKGNFTIPNEAEVDEFLKYNLRRRENKKKLTHYPKEIQRLKGVIKDVENQMPMWKGIDERRVRHLESEKLKALKEISTLENGLEEIKEEEAEPR